MSHRIVAALACACLAFTVTGVADAQPRRSAVLPVRRRRHCRAGLRCSDERADSPGPDSGDEQRDLRRRAERRRRSLPAHQPRARGVARDRLERRLLHVAARSAPSVRSTSADSDQARTAHHDERAIESGRRDHWTRLGRIRRAAGGTSRPRLSREDGERLPATRGRRRRRSDRRHRRLPNFRLAARRLLRGRESSHGAAGFGRPDDVLADLLSRHRASSPKRSASEWTSGPSPPRSFRCCRCAPSASPARPSPRRGDRRMRS